ncbi:hypothetical protein GCM10010168_46800 [Actinoplanes ianthinogenes]|uniref:PH domain-containing protein n=2 Tax=Actinoplanes ianthinogenes TaxID=122358 RepID=A0ABM7LP49_9ACTN|nr:hypothetical protein Aiant_16780 [Actinoplanes ianthinogenes]GGR23450.1 hypothetical protein GCM10010168_46800 [Actinoplanes ianthinogenes]
MALRMVTILAVLLPVGLGLSYALLSLLGHTAHLWQALRDTVLIFLFTQAGVCGRLLIGRKGQRFAWVRTSDAGLAFAAYRRAARFVPWTAVRSVRVRCAGPLAELVITPETVDAVIVMEGGVPAQRPVRRRRAPAFVVDIGMMRPGNAAMLAEIHDRLSRA